jgi:hypothetical protein
MEKFLLFPILFFVLAAHSYIAHVLVWSLAGLLVGGKVVMDCVGDAFVECRPSLNLSQ